MLSDGTWSFQIQECGSSLVRLVIVVKHASSHMRVLILAFMVLLIVNVRTCSYQSLSEWFWRVLLLLDLSECLRCHHPGQGRKGHATARQKAETGAVAIQRLNCSSFWVIVMYSPKHEERLSRWVHCVQVKTLPVEDFFPSLDYHCSPSLDCHCVK